MLVRVSKYRTGAGRYARRMSAAAEWAAKRTEAIERAKQLRAERKKGVVVDDATFAPRCPPPTHPAPPVARAVCPLAVGWFVGVSALVCACLSRRLRPPLALHSSALCCCYCASPRRGALSASRLRSLVVRYVAGTSSDACVSALSLALQAAAAATLCTMHLCKQCICCRGGAGVAPRCAACAAGVRSSPASTAFTAATPLHPSTA
jgi:hypothetical protein